MNFFKSIDKRLESIGFTKISEDEHGCEYQRKDEKYGYTQEVCIIKKNSGHHILQSYDNALFDSKGIGNTCVGLTSYEMSLFVKKMKQIGLYSK